MADIARFKGRARMKDKARIKKFVLLVIFLSISSGIAVSAAKVPQIGDHVLIVSGDYTFLLIGNITSIDDNLICLNASVSTGSSEDLSEPGDACAGMGSITILKWLDLKELASYQEEKELPATPDKEKGLQTTIEFPKSQWRLEAAKIAERMRG